MRTWVLFVSVAFAGLMWMGSGGCSTSAKKRDAGAGGSYGGNGGSSGGSGSGSGGSGGSGGGNGGGSGGSGGARDAGNVPDLPPETGEKKSFDLPQAGARYVYVANPKRDTVAVIDSQTLTIKSVDAGDGPTYLRTLPGKDAAIVINVASHDATIIRTDATGSKTSTVALVPGANALAVAPDGRHAVAWTDPSQTGVGAGGFQDVSLITLSDGTSGSDGAVALSVGFRPSDVVFAQDGSAAFVVTEDGVSILRFAAITGPTITPLVPVGDAAGGALSRGVAVTANGRYALARREGESSVRLVDLASGDITSFDAGTPVTDLAVAPDGSFALGVLRAVSAVVRIPIPGGFDDPNTAQRIDVPGEIIGSAAITPDGGTALLYTTAAMVERLTLLPLRDGGAPRTLRLRKSVRAVAVAPDGKTALVLHNKLPGDPADPMADAETRIDRSYGYSLVKIADGFTKLQLTPVDPGAIALVPDGSKAFLLLRDDTASLRQAERIDFASFLVDDFTLGSPPSSIGVVPGARRVFVGQVHPEGRLSFIDWATGETASVTGFELNGRIVD